MNAHKIFDWNRKNMDLGEYDKKEGRETNGTCLSDL